MSNYSEERLCLECCMPLEDWEINVCDRCYSEIMEEQYIDQEYEQGA